MYCSKHEQQCFFGFKNTRLRLVFLNPIKHCCEFFERLQKHSTKSVCLRSPNKGSNCEGKILAYKKNKLCLISILYIKNTTRSVLSGYKAHARDALSVF